jgi:hypothetical protein
MRYATIEKLTKVVIGCEAVKLRQYKRAAKMSPKRAMSSPGDQADVRRRCREAFRQLSMSMQSGIATPASHSASQGDSRDEPPASHGRFGATASPW